MNTRFFAATLIVLVSGCSCEKELREVTETELTPGATWVASSFDGLLTVTIPAGSLDHAATMTIETLRDLSPPSLVSAPYAISLDPGSLSGPVSIRLVIESPGHAALATVEGENVAAVEDSIFDPRNRAVGANVLNLGIYCAVERETPDSGVPADPDGGIEPDAEPEDTGGLDAEVADLGDVNLYDAGVECPSSSMPMSGVDLRVGCSVPPGPSWPVGSTQSVTFDIDNIGNLASGPFDTVILLSANQLITLSDVLIGSFHTADLAPLTSMTVTASVTVPSATAPGAWYVGVVVDSDSAIIEPREQNNIKRVGLLMVTP